MPSYSSPGMAVPLLILNLVATPASLIGQQPLAEVPSPSFRASSRLVMLETIPFFHPLRAVQPRFETGLAPRPLPSPS